MPYSKLHSSKPEPSNLVAHRGYQAKYPENTALSLNKAIAAGALFIELDVQFSADQLPIIYHDTDLQRVSGLPVTVFSTSREDLLTYPAYESPNDWASVLSRRQLRRWKLWWICFVLIRRSLPLLSLKRSQ